MASDIWHTENGKEDSTYENLVFYLSKKCELQKGITHKAGDSYMDQ